jgi:dTMP kinase
MHRITCGNLQPDLTVLMDSDVAASVARARRRNLSRVATAQDGEADENRFEQENQAFFARVQQAYHVIAKRDANRVLMLDARRSPDVVHDDIVDAVRQRFLGAAKSA